MNRSRITKLAFVIVFICFLLSTFVSLWSLRVMAKHNRQELSKQLAARIYDTIAGELSEPVTVASTMAHDQFLIDMLEQEDSYASIDAVATLRRYLSGIREGLDYETAFVVSEGSRRYYASNGLSRIIDPEAIERDRWYQDFLSTNRAYDLDVDRDEFAHDSWTVFVDARVEDDAGKLLGVCGVGRQMNSARALFEELEREYNVKISLVDPDGLVQVDTDEASIQKARVSGIRLEEGADYHYQKQSGGRFAITRYIDRLGWYLVVQSDGAVERGQFLNVILLNVILCLLVMVILVIAIRIIVERTKALADASFLDQTTQLLNRRAFEEAKAEWSSVALDTDFVYMTADLNGLKAANDNLGHTAGDELIRGAADCLRTCFGQYGKVYRIGGDEFAAMLVLTPEQQKAVMAKFDSMTDAWKGEKVDHLSISCGWASCREFPSENIAELSRISDERMYAAKEAYYQRSGHARRT